MNAEKTRKRLFSYLDAILKVSHKKFDVNNKQDKERRAWARLTVTSIQAYGKLLETAQLDELKKDVELIRKELNLNVEGKSSARSRIH